MNKTMRRLIMVAMVVGMLIILGRVGWWESHYFLEGTIVDINNDTIFIADNNGELWSYYTDDNNTFHVNDSVKMVMFNNFTDLNIYDDEIENIPLK